MLLAATGCSDEPPDTSGIATYEATGEGGDGALLEGRILVDADCVYVKPGFEEIVLPVFPLDEVERDGDVFRYDGQDYVNGDEISLGGGAGTAAGFKEADIPDTCDAEYPLWIVAQSG